MRVFALKVYGILQIMSAVLQSVVVRISQRTSAKCEGRWYKIFSSFRGFSHKPSNRPISVNNDCIYLLDCFSSCLFNKRWNSIKKAFIIWFFNNLGHFASSILFITFAGTPTATTLSGMSSFTKLNAPMIEFSPIVTPARTEQTSKIPKNISRSPKKRMRNGIVL